jgi:hypothetical protein
MRGRSLHIQALFVAGVRRVGDCGQCWRSVESSAVAASQARPVTLRRHRSSAATSPTRSSTRLLRDKAVEAFDGRFTVARYEQAG